jgi:hypothetical protein
MKGVELPINVLVIIVIAVIVLLAIVAVYFAGWTPYASSAGVDAIKNDACRKMSYDCSKDPTTIEITNFDVDGDGSSGVDASGAPIDTGDNLQELCETYYDVGPTDLDACRRLCGCI